MTGKAASVAVTIGTDGLIRLISMARSGKSYTTVLHADEANTIAGWLKTAAATSAAMKAGGGTA